MYDYTPSNLPQLIRDLPDSLRPGRIMAIEILDHLIVAESGCYSFKSQAGGIL